jgi:hypothetical protein
MAGFRNCKRLSRVLLGMVSAHVMGASKVLSGTAYFSVCATLLKPWAADEAVPNLACRVKQRRE